MFTRNHVCRSTRPWRTSALVLGVTVGALLLAEPALAAHWGPLSSSYKGKVRVQGEGDFYKCRGALYLAREVPLQSARVEGGPSR